MVTIKEFKNYIRPDLSVLLVETSATIAVTSGNLSDFENNELEFVVEEEL